MGIFRMRSALFAGTILSSVLSLGAQGVEFTVKSQAVGGPSETGFDSGLKSAGRIDPQYAASDKGPGNPKSLPFSWSGLPPGTKSLALILDDPDARLVLASYGMKGDAFLHWIAADIDPSSGSLPANSSASHPAYIQGKNGAGSIGYTGPQPPSDIPKDAKKPLIHVYRLVVYALSGPSGLKNGFTEDELRAAISSKVLGQGTLLFSFSN